jgi:peroxiredoxin Q/BCP
VIEAYGSWAPKKLFGRDFVGIHRDTYLIDPSGDIVKKYEGVDPKTHIGDIIKDLEKQKAP